MSVQPTSAVDICNLALDRIGQAVISSIDSPENSTEDACARHYDAARRELLRSYIFNFARKMDVWTADASVTPAFGFSTAYKLPNDFIRLMALGDLTVLSGDTPGFLYELNDGYLYCDSGDAVDGGIQVQYIFDAKNVSRFDPLFIKALKLSLARNMAYAFTLSKTLVKSIEDELKDVLLAAAAVAGQEKPPRRVQRSRFRDVRRAGGIFRDNTRI